MPIDNLVRDGTSMAKEAQAALAKFYISQGIDPDIATKYAGEIPGDELAGLRHGESGNLPSIYPTLEELKGGFSILVEEVGNRAAIAILLTNPDVRAYYSKQNVHLLGARGIRSNAQNIMHEYHRQLDMQSAKRNPIRAAISALEEMSRTR